MQHTDRKAQDIQGRNRQEERSTTQNNIACNTIPEQTREHNITQKNTHTQEMKTHETSHT